MLEIVFQPLSFLIERIYKIRRTLYKSGFLKSHKLNKPVISIGNLSLGGSGKTPFLIELVKYLESRNKVALVLTRGYKSKFENSSLLTSQLDGTDSSLLGDEALLMRNSFKSPLLIGKDRFKNYLKNKSESKYDFIVLDDGFQHLKIKRDLDIVLIDATLKKDKFKVFPSGYLREGVSALDDADYKIFTKTNLTDNDNLKFYSQFNFDHHLTLNFDGYFTINEQAAEIPVNSQVIVITSIAKPETFIEGLLQESLVIHEHINLKDHSEISQDKINSVLKRAHKKDLKIVCTEKDIVKLRKLTDDDIILYKKVSFNFDKFDSLLKDFLND